MSGTAKERALHRKREERVERVKMFLFANYGGMIGTPGPYQREFEKLNPIEQQSWRSEAETVFDIATGRDVYFKRAFGFHSPHLRRKK